MQGDPALLTGGCQGLLVDLGTAVFVLHGVVASIPRPDSVDSMPQTPDEDERPWWSDAEANVFIQQPLVFDAH